MSRYEARPWRPWYLPDSASWLDLSLGARGLAADLLRKFDNEGKLHVRKLSDLGVLLRLDWEREVRPAVEELISKGRVNWDPESGTLTDPDFDDRKRPDSAARARRRSASGRTIADSPDKSGQSASVQDTTDKSGQRGLSSSSSSSSGSDLVSREHEVGQSVVRPDPFASSPGWWDDVLGTIGMSCGIDIPSADSWLRYAGHRHGKSMPATREDAVQWLTTVMVPEARKQRDQARRDRERDASFKARFDKPAGFVEHEQRTAQSDAQAQVMADELAKRLAARKRGAA